MVAHGRTRAAAAAMTEQGNILAGFETKLGVSLREGEQTKLDEVIARA